MTLKEIRTSKSISQKDASALCFVSLRTYKRLENDANYSKSPKYLHCVKTLSEQQSKKRTLINKENIIIVGAGYVGISLATLLSKKHRVTLFDIDNKKIEMINNKVSPLRDKGIEDSFRNDKLDLTAKYINKEDYKYATAVFLSLPTDYDEKSGLFNTSILNKTIKDIRQVNKTVKIIIKSTVAVGYTDSLNDSNIIFCPEFLREGRALFDSEYPSRIIIGSSKFDSKTKHIGLILSNSAKNNPPVLYMSTREAETVKLFANTYLAMRVSFFNELDSFLLNNGLNSKKVITGVCLDSRIGDYYNNPSFGYGGYCLPKDTQVLSNLVSKNNNSDLITSISKSNLSRKHLVAEAIIDEALKRTNKNIKDIKIGIYSFSSKSGSDNTRFAALHDVMKILVDFGLNVLVFDKSKCSDEKFYQECDLIVANRYSDVPSKFLDKTYSRDVFFNN